MGAFWSFFKGKEPQTPIKGIGPRIKNIIIRNYRGLLGSLVPLCALAPLIKKDDHAMTVQVMWMCMFWCFLLQPVNIPVTGLIPLFMLPMGGVIKSDTICSCYMNEGIAMFILGNMLLLLWNNSGLDRRIMLWFLSAGDAVQCSANRLVFKCCTASFFLSMFSSKLIVSNIMIQYITPIMTNLQSAARASDTKYDELRYILNNAIQTSCSIGSITIVHSSYATLAFRAIFQSTVLTKDTAWFDIFNYLEYTSFALPTAIVMLLLNIAYNILLVKIKAGTPMSAVSMNKVRTTLMNHKKDIPSKITLHEKLTLFFSILVLFIYFFRWTKYFSGWAGKFDVHENVPGVRDATVAATFVILLHSLPSGYRFVKIWTAKKKSQFGAAKPESAILWWRFVDKNINYGYLFLIGSGVAISVASLDSGLNKILAENKFGKTFSDQSTLVFILIVCVLAVILANIMSSVASIVIFVPFVMNLFTVPPGRRMMGDFDDPILRQIPNPAQKLDKIYLGALAAGLCASYGFMNPFLYTPAYFCFYTGKVPRKKMAIYGLGSAIICLLVTWAFITFYAPVLWNAADIKQVAAKVAGPATPGGTETPATALV